MSEDNNGTVKEIYIQGRTEIVPLALLDTPTLHPGTS